MDLTYNYFRFRIDAKRPLFVGVSGAHSYGTAKPDSDLDIIVVRIPSLEWALALSRDESGKQTSQTGKLGTVEVKEHNLYHFCSVLLHGNATFLENIFQEHLYEDPCFKDFRWLVLRHGLSKRSAGHFYGFIRSSLKDYARKKRIKQLLYGYRIYLSGICFFTQEKVIYNLYELLEFASKSTQETVLDLLEIYKTEADEIMPSDELAQTAVQQLTAAKFHFGYPDPQTRNFIPSMMVERSVVPEVPRYEPFNEWIRKILLKEDSN